MSYFANGTLEDEILSDVQYFQRKNNATNSEIIKALAEVFMFFAEQLSEEQK